MTALASSSQITGSSDIIAPENLGSKRHIHTVLLIALFAVEAMIFYAHVARDIAPYYPSNFDQLAYYLATYDLTSAFHARGPSVLVEELLQPNNATGTTFVLQGALLSLIGGENRTAILSVNLVYLLTLQFVFFVVIRTRTGSTDLAWIGMALMLSLSTLFNDRGGIYDYRIDFSAFCLYGTWTCLLVWSGSFLRTRRTLVAAAVGILLVYSRFFTIVYVGGVLGTLLAINTYRIWRNPSPYRTAVAARRIRNILLSGTIIAVICGARLFLSRAAIYDYYVVGHVLGEEKFIRAHELGIYTVAGHLLYYPKSILENHVGLLTLLMTGALAGWSLWSQRVTTSELFTRLRRFRQEFITLGLAILIPVAFLTINVSKSPVVGGIVAVPILLALVLFGAAVWPRGGRLELAPPWTRMLPALVMAIALTAFVSNALSSKDLPARADLQRITLLAKTIAAYAADNSLTRLTMSSDRVVDYQNAATPKLFSIEILHRHLDIDPRFGHGVYGIFATSREDALRLFADSDVIVLTDAVTDRSHPYPMNTKIKEYWDELWQWTNQNRALLFSTEIYGIPYRVFVRPLPRWKTSIGGRRPATALHRARLVCDFGTERRGILQCGVFITAPA